MKQKRFKVVIRKYKNKDKTTWETVGVVVRKLTAKAIGNFNPIFCVYNKKEYLVHSVLGDVSDPFRRTEDFLEYLYIEI